MEAATDAGSMFVTFKHIAQSDNLLYVEAGGDYVSPGQCGERWSVCGGVCVCVYFDIRVPVVSSVEAGVLG